MMIPQRFNIWSLLTVAGIVHHVYVAFNTLALHMLVDPQQSLFHRQALELLPSSLPETTAAHFFLRPPVPGKLLDQDHRHHHHHHHKVASLFPDSCQANISAWDKIYEKGDDSHHGKIQPHSAFYNNTATTFPAKTTTARRDLRYSKQTTLKILQTVIREHSIETMIDIPCGDVNWIFDSWETDGALKLYVGLDGVPAVITSNQKRLAHHSNKVKIHFLQKKQGITTIYFHESSHCLTHHISGCYICHFSLSLGISGLGWNPVPHAPCSII
jgi:hypothetical protein